MTHRVPTWRPVSLADAAQHIAGRVVLREAAPIYASDGIGVAGPPENRYSSDQNNDSIIELTDGTFVAFRATMHAATCESDGESLDPSTFWIGTL